MSAAEAPAAATVSFSRRHRGRGQVAGTLLRRRQQEPSTGCHNWVMEQCACTRQVAGPPAPIPPPMTARAGAHLDGLAQGDASEGGGGQGSSHVGGSCGRHHRAATAAGERRGAWRARSGSRPQRGTSGAGIGLQKASPEPLDCPCPAAPHWRPTCDGRAAEGWVGLEGGAGGRNAPIDCSQGLGRSGQLLPYHPRLFWHKRQKPAARTAR